MCREAPWGVCPSPNMQQTRGPTRSRQNLGKATKNPTRLSCSQSFHCGSIRLSQSFMSRPHPRSPHLRLKGRLRCPRSTQVDSLSESTQLRMGSAFAREREERLPCSLLPAHRVTHAARCPILLGGIVIGNQAGGFARGPRTSNHSLTARRRWPELTVLFSLLSHVDCCGDWGHIAG
jgi:hypothetical protein